MRKRTKNQRPTKGIMGRLVVALIKETGVRLSAEDVQVLRVLIVAAARNVRREGREAEGDQPLPSIKGRSSVH